MGRKSVSSVRVLLDPEPDAGCVRFHLPQAQVGGACRVGGREVAGWRQLPPAGHPLAQHHWGPGGHPLPHAAASSPGPPRHAVCRAC